MKRIEDVAIDRSWSYRVNRRKSEIKHFFQTKLFPRLYERKLQRAMEEYNKKEAEK